MAFFPSKHSQEFKLCDAGNLVFHWADFYETCDGQSKEDFNHKKEVLNKLSHIPVWIKTPLKVYQFSVYDLYESYILNKFKKDELDPHCPLEISFISQSGPFKSMAISECFNTVTYRDFIWMYLLEGKLPRRDYRIRLKSRILMEYGKEFNGADVISLEQMSVKGILLSMSSEIYLKKISQQDKIRLLLNSTTLSQSKDKSLLDLKNYLAQYSFNLLYSSRKEDGIICEINDFTVQSAFDFSQNKKVYLFISYDNLAKSNPVAVEKMKEFVHYTRGLIRGNYPINEKIWVVQQTTKGVNQD